MGRFQPGNPGGPGRPPGSQGAQTKAWLLSLMREVLESGNPRDQLKELMGKNFFGYMKLMVSLCPRDHKIEMNYRDIFEGKSTEELEHFANTGQWIGEDLSTTTKLVELPRLDPDGQKD